jgi:hypothetical protein
MRWIGRLILLVIVLAALAWGAAVVLGPGQIERQIARQFGGAVQAEALTAGVTGRIEATGVRAAMPGAPEARLASLSVVPGWSGGPGLRFAARALTIPELELTLQDVSGSWFPLTSRRGPLLIEVASLSMPGLSMEGARLEAILDQPAATLTDIRIEGLGLAAEAPMLQPGARLSAARFEAANPLISAVRAGATEAVFQEVAGELAQGEGGLWIGGVENARVTASIAEIPLDSPVVRVPARAEANVPGTPELAATLALDAQLSLAGMEGCTAAAPLACATGIADARGTLDWTVEVAGERTAGGAVCETMPCLPRFRPLEVSDAQGFGEALAQTAILSPLVVGAIMSEFARATQ